jgi:hypothetical protein
MKSKNVKIKNIQNYHFTAVFYGCETWSLTLRDEHRIIRRMFEPKRLSDRRLEKTA